MAMRALAQIVGVAGLALAAALPAAGQDIPADALTPAVTVEPARVPPGGSGTLRVRLTLTPGHHIYAHDAEFVPTTVAAVPVAGVTFGAPTYPPAHVVDRWGEQSREYEGTTEITIPFTVAADAAAGERTLTALLDYQICTDQVCANAVKDSPVTAVFTVDAAAAPTPGPVPAPAPAPGDPSGLSFTAFMLFCIGGGLVSLIMPCVYPLIPITVTFFAKQAGESGQGRTMRLALTYAAGIITSFTVLGASLSAALGATAANKFAADPWVNTVITLVFLYLTLGLFGMVPMDLPQGLKNRLSGGGPQRGFVGAYLLGLLFTVVTFTCVIPVAGGLMLVAATEGGFWYGTFGMLVYSTTMALPFLALGLFPALIRKMPMGGGWLHAVKMTGGFVELALVVYYWTKADQGFFGRDVFVNHDLALALYVGAFLLAGTYLLGIWRTPEDGESRAIGAPRMLFAFVFVVFGLYLGTGLAGRDLGVMEALLPLRPEGDVRAGTITAAAPTRYEEFEAGMAEARATGKPAFVEFTGFT